MAEVPQGSQLGLEAYGVGLVALGYDHEEGQYAAVPDPGPCAGPRIPMREPVTVRAVAIRGEQVAAGDIFTLRAPPVGLPRVWDGRLRPLRLPFRPIRADERPLHSHPDPCGSRILLSEEVVRFARPVNPQHADLRDDGLVVVEQIEGSWVLQTSTSVVPLDVSGRVERLHQGKLFWTDEQGTWSAPLNALHDRSLVRVNIDREDEQIAVAGHQIEELTGHRMKQHDVKNEQIRLLTRDGERTVLSELDLSGRVLRQLELPTGDWRLNRGNLERFKKRTSAQGWKHRGVFEWTAAGLVAIEPQSAPVVKPPDVRIHDHALGLKVEKWGCSHDGLGIPARIDL